MAAKSPRPLAGKGFLYQHSPNVVDQFDFADLHTSYYPLPGMDFHNNPELARWVQKYGKAPDAMFQHGIAAPPLGKNTSGLRNYTVDFTGDPNMVINLDVPLASQTASVRDTLARMGIKNDEAWFGEPLTPAELLWQRSLELSPPSTSSGLPAKDMNPANFEDFARRLAAGDPELDGLRNYVAPTLLEALVGQGIPAATRRGPGWGAGAAYGPQSIGRNPASLLESEAAAARDAGDILRAQEIENRLADATGFSDLPPGVNVPAPIDGTREYKVFNPRFVDIKKVASLLGAAGLAGAAGSASAASPDMATPPEESLPPSVDGPAARATDPAQYREFSRAFERAMAMPVVKYRGEAVTPDAFLGDLARRSGFSELSVVNARNRLAGLNYDPGDVEAEALREVLLETMRDQQPDRNNPEGWSTGYDPARHEAPKDRYALTPDGEQGYQAERAYNLISTFEDGDLTPRYATTGSKILSGIGTAFAPYFHAAAGDAAGAGDTMNLFLNDTGSPEGRMASSMYWWNRGEPDGTSGDALTGAKFPSLSTTTFDGLSTKLSNTDNYIPYFWQQLPEGRVYNPDLLMRELSIPTSAWAAAPPVYMPPQMDATPEGVDPYYGRENTLVQELRDKLYRTTPIYPGGADPAEMQQLTRDLRDFDMMNRGFGNAEFPMLLKGMGLEPQFMPEAGEMAWNAPRDMMDGSLFLGAVPGLARAASRVGKAATTYDAARTAAKEAGRAAKYMGKEIKDETPLNAAIAIGNSQEPGAGGVMQGLYDFGIAPKKSGIVTDDDGRPAAANDPNYPKYLDQTYKRRENMLRSLLDRSNNLYAPSVTSPSRASLLNRQTD